MKLITSITNQPKQRIVLTLDNNESAIMHLYYMPTQTSWYFDLEYKDYVNNGNKVVLSMNAIRHLRRKLPFGIAFVASSYAEPSQLNDFVDGTVFMLQLNEEDVQLIESEVYSAE